jgi:hypothetical protein
MKFLQAASFSLSGFTARGLLLFMDGENLLQAKFSAGRDKIGTRG